MKSNIILNIDAFWVVNWCHIIKIVCRYILNTDNVKISVLEIEINERFAICPVLLSTTCDVCDLSNIYWYSSFVVSHHYTGHWALTYLSYLFPRHFIFFKLPTQYVIASLWTRTRFHMLQSQTNMFLKFIVLLLLLTKNRYCHIVSHFGFIHSKQNIKLLFESAHKIALMIILFFSFSFFCYCYSVKMTSGQIKLEKK